MRNIHYTVALALVVIWSIAYLGFHPGKIIHLLLLLAFIVVLVRLLKGEKPL